MSVGRVKGDALDRYDTPRSVVDDFLAAWPYGDPEFVVEPAAGSGRIIDAVKYRWPRAGVVGFDIDPRRDDIIRKDWLDLLGRSTAAGAPDLIITNPPFRLAEQFLRTSMGQTSAHVALLLRAGFLESARRASLLAEFPPMAVYFLRSRPRFTGPNTKGGTDTAMYAWFVWLRDHRPDHFEGRLL